MDGKYYGIVDGKLIPLEMKITNGEDGKIHVNHSPI